MNTDLATGATRRPELRAEVKAAMVAAMGAVGSRRVTQSAIVTRFMDRGASRATLFRWVRAGVTSGRVALRAACQAGDKAVPPAERPAPRAADGAAKTAALLPARPSPDDATARPGRRLRTLDRLAKTVADVERRVACLEAQAKLAQAGTDKFQAFMVDGMRKLLPPEPPPNFCGSCMCFDTGSAGDQWCGAYGKPRDAADLACDIYQLAKCCA